MKRSRIMSLGLAVALLSAPAVGADRNADIKRSSEASDSSSELRGNSTLLFLGAIVAVALGIVLLIDDDDSVSA